MSGNDFFELYKLSSLDLLGFALVLVRVSCMFVTWPILGSETIPAQLKILLSLLVTILVYPTIASSTLADSKQLLGSELLPWFVVREALCGAIMGMLARGFFYSLTICGELVSVAIGLSTDQILNPAIGGRAGALDQLYIMTGSVLFLGMNGHHYLIEALVRSFQIIPIVGIGLNVAVFKSVGGLVTEIIVVGIKMAAPVVATVFLVNIGLGLVSRLVPQVNILVTSASVNVLAGLMILTISLPLLAVNQQDFILEMTGIVMNFIKGM
jgi:flagellar biosynthetic protein FliR